MIDLPRDCAALNSWIQTHFNCAEISRAYFELPFQASVGGPGTPHREYLHRAVAISLGFMGHEEDCCQAIAAYLLTCITRDQFVDQSEPLFVRRWFEFAKDPLVDRTYVGGRLAFWDLAKYRKLMAASVYKPEGAVYAAVSMPDNWFESSWGTR